MIYIKGKIGLIYFAEKNPQKRDSEEVPTQISYQEVVARNILYRRKENEV